MKKLLILPALFFSFIFAQRIRVDSSSTVYPFTLVISKEFNTEIKITWDVLTVLASPDNYQVDCLTFGQLYFLWKPDISVEIPKIWSDSTPRVDNWALNFTKIIKVESGSRRAEPFSLKDATIIPRGDEEIRYAMDHFGFAYYLDG